jgi:hypothetical protein
MPDTSETHAIPKLSEQVADLERLVNAVRLLAVRYGNHATDAFAGETIFADIQLALGPTHAVKSLQA